MFPYAPKGYSVAKYAYQRGIIMYCLIYIAMNPIRNKFYIYFTRSITENTNF